jgi:hypothetical protein
MTRLPPPTGLSARFIDLQIGHSLERFDRLEELTHLHVARRMRADGEEARLRCLRDAVAQMDRELGLRACLRCPAEQLLAASPLLQAALLCDLHWFFHRSEASHPRRGILAQAEMDESMLTALGVLQAKGKGGPTVTEERVRTLWSLPLAHGLSLSCAKYLVVRLFLGVFQTVSPEEGKVVPTDRSAYGHLLGELKRVHSLAFFRHGLVSVERGTLARAHTEVKAFARAQKVASEPVCA